MALRITSLTFVGFYINSLLQDHPGDLDFEEVYRMVEDQSVLEDLASRYPGETDFSLFGSDSDQRVPLLRALQDAGGGLEGRERRKVGIDSCGLNLLMAFILEAIQRVSRS